MNSAAIVLGNNLKYIFKDLMPDDKIFVIPNGGNYPEFEKHNILIKEKYNSSDSHEEKKSVKILYLANLLPSKGIADVIAAMHLIEPIAKLLVVGAWPNDKFRKTCFDLVGSRNNILFYPPADKNKKIDFLAHSDVFVFPPNQPEGHPWVIVEAMAAGLPIISTNQGAITESVIDGVNGFIVEPNNPKQIAEKLQSLIEDHELRQQMGKASREMYEEKFTEEIMTAKIANVFYSCSGLKSENDVNTNGEHFN
jgi:glycosyltransferase involved in cell wall biosynthesis